MSDRFVRIAGSLLERRSTRRGFLARATVVGSALAVAPGRYLLRPETALAVTVPGQCPAGARCRTSNYTEFCCSLFNRWGKNYCPSYSYIGGWWKCAPYQGAKLCTRQNYRYYVDCNVLPSKSCTCKCTGNKCHYRRTCCNNFKYGNCNGHIGTTPVVCRVIRCVNPGTVYAGCSVHGGYDYDTCTHEAVCNCGQCV